MCPALALSLTKSPAAPRAVAPAPAPAIGAGPLPARPAIVAQTGPPPKTKKGRLKNDLAVSAAWIATIGGRDPAGRG